MWKRLAAYFGRSTAWSLALAASSLGWIPYFTGASYDKFLAVTVVIGLLLAAWTS